MRRATCFKHTKNRKDRTAKPQCRMAMPAGYWPHKTQMIGRHWAPGKDTPALDLANAGNKADKRVSKSARRASGAASARGDTNKKQLCEEKGVVKTTLVFFRGGGGGPAFPNGRPNDSLHANNTDDEDS